MQCSPYLSREACLARTRALVAAEADRLRALGETAWQGDTRLHALPKPLRLAIMWAVYWPETPDPSIEEITP
jgi:hypothetical protein